MPLSSSIVTRLQYQHLSIREITGGLPEDALHVEVNPGKWSAFTNIAHLTAYQPMFLARLERIRNEPSPLFDRYVADNDPLFPGYLDRSPASLLDQIATDRSRIIAFMTECGEPFLTRTATHPKFGLLTTIDWTEFFLLHEAHHLYTLFALVHARQ